MLLEFGAFGPLLGREEVVSLEGNSPARLLYASDLHLGHWWTARLPQRLHETAVTARPEVILLGGDLVDRAGACRVLKDLVVTLMKVAPVAAVPGNHDQRVDADRVRQAVIDAGGIWLPDQPLREPWMIDGVITSKPAGILCTHDPNLFPDAVAAGYRLVLAGHLHGGQCVLSHRGRKQWPAVWLNRWHAERFSHSDAVMLVSRGAADTIGQRWRHQRQPRASNCG